MTRWNRWRLSQARRWEPRWRKHPWLWSAPFPLLTVIVPTLVNLADGENAGFDLKSNLVAAPVVWVVLRWFMPRANRWNLARFERRFGSEPGM